MRNRADIQEIKFLNRHADSRRIRVTFSKKEVYLITSFRNWISIDYCDDETHRLLRTIALENIYWLLGLDEKDEADIKNGYIESLAEMEDGNIKRFKHLFEKYGCLTRSEYQYIIKHYLDSFYKNFKLYPYAVDVKKIVK